MKKILVAAAMLAVMAGSASAQGGGGGGMQMTPEQMAARMAAQVDVMFKGITITDAIKAKAVDILTRAQADGRGVDRAAPDAADQRKKITDKRNADLAMLLSNDGDKKMLADNIAAMPTGRGGRPPVTR
jgi:Spy/CpxP family protein refolding chaperone